MMAEARRLAITPQLDTGQILLEAQHRWLRPAEICEILRNYRKFCIAPEPPNRPSSGSLFLFDRKVLRYFRKDGHNWRKKKDGKTVKEAHERLKAGSVDVLHCYYAHGEDNDKFQRRSYWMLEEDYMHIVLVHYREVESSKANFNRAKDSEENARIANMDSPSSSTSFTNQCQLPSPISDAASPNSTQTSEYEDAEADNYQASSRHHPYFEVQQFDGLIMDKRLLNPYVSPLNDQYDHQRPQTIRRESDFYSVAQEDTTSIYNETGHGLTFSGPTTQFGLTSWDEVLEHCTTEFHGAPFERTVASTQVVVDDVRQDPLTLEDYFKNNLTGNIDDIVIGQGNSVWELPNIEAGYVAPKLDMENDPSMEGKMTYATLLKQLSLDVRSTDGEGLKKYDSFSRWMSNELGEVDSSQPYWSTIESGNVVGDANISNQELDPYLVGPSLSQDQLFSIAAFSPNWAYEGLETRVLVNGTFLNKKDVEKCKWSCMFGEVEVPAEVLEDGTLLCHAPPHKIGQVPFYITCSNRVACSEVREFEYRAQKIQNMDTKDSYITRVNEMNLQDLHIRLENILSLRSNEHPKLDSGVIKEKQQLVNEINSLMMDGDDEWVKTLNHIGEEDFFPDNAHEQLCGDLLKEKLHTWLIYKLAEDGKGPSVLDKEGQGVLHLAAVLGYDWVIKPTVTAGVSVNFRDVRGWTALHWAASCGRENTVAALIGLGADPGLLTDPTPDFPSGRTPADLASESGHKGIAGFLAESSLTSHLNVLTLKDSKDSNLAGVSGATGIKDVAEQTAVALEYGDMQAEISLKDSLSAVRNAAQAAARIHQVYRVQSFHRKQLTEYGDQNCGMSDERALSLIALKTANSGRHDSPVHAAAIRIQNKFRGWKGRKEFLVIRQRIVKIQAHVRGHQVRKQYKKVVWTVGILEKAILRWRRKGSGLRGFRPEGLLEGDSAQNRPQEEDDYDFLQEGRKQSEARLEKALARVKSMVQYPEARDQYRRLVNVVTGLQESKEDAMNETEPVNDDFMIELEEICDDDIFMPTARM